jgi:PPOX class probable F420-dependent enzyme
VHELSEEARRLIDEPNLGFLATVNRDGSPQVSPVWIDDEEGQVLVNTAAGRAKERNMRRDPRVAISVVSRGDDYRRIEIRGRVVEIVEGEEAERHIDRMARKYRGDQTYRSRRPGERRVLVKIAPDRVFDRA